MFVLVTDVGLLEIIYLQVQMLLLTVEAGIDLETAGQFTVDLGYQNAMQVYWLKVLLQ